MLECKPYITEREEASSTLLSAVQRLGCNKLGHFIQLGGALRNRAAGRAEVLSSTE
jgi:hypothetical protein